MHIVAGKHPLDPIDHCMKNRTHVQMLVALVIVGVVGVRAQDDSSYPVPTWPGDRESAAIPEGKYVFLTPDRHDIIVLVPKDKDLKGPKIPIRVPLKNDLKPSISISVLSSGGLGGLFTYQYSLANKRVARDAIGSFTLVVPAQDSSLEVPYVPPVPGHAWPGARAHAVIASQAIFPWVPRGRYLHWFQQPERNVVTPGKVIDGFTIKSSFLPGLTTAWLSSGELVNFDQSWPEEIFKQLELLEDFRFRRVFVPTIGPMFTSTTPKPLIAGELVKDLQALVKYGWLRPASLFTKEALRLAQDIVTTNLSARPRAMNTASQTDTEKAVALAFQISLGIVSPATKPEAQRKQK